MSYFVAIAVYRCEIDGAPAGSVDIKALCVEAPTASDAAHLLRTQPTHSYRNSDGELVSWPLTSIPNIQGLAPIGSGSEIIGLVVDSDDFAGWVGHAT